MQFLLHAECKINVYLLCSVDNQTPFSATFYKYIAIYIIMDLCHKLLFCVINLIFMNLFTKVKEKDILTNSYQPKLNQTVVFPFI